MDQRNVDLPNSRAEHIVTPIKPVSQYLREHPLRKTEKKDVVITRPPAVIVPPSSPSGSSKYSLSSQQAQEIAKHTVVLIIASKRQQYLQRTLTKISEYHPRHGFPVIVSEDGVSAEMRSVIESFAKKMSHPTVATVKPSASVLYQGLSPGTADVWHIHHPQWREPADNGYFKLAKHFKYALDAVFGGGVAQQAAVGSVSSRLETVDRVILLEEDIEIAPDFFEYFTAMAPILDADPTGLLCASAWNDNGLSGMVKDNSQVYRSDFFPGLGWMLTRAVWEELSPKWPRAYWDDWLREPPQRKGRHILRPEVSRTYHIGVEGVSRGQYSNFLTNIALSQDFYPFTAPPVPLSYLQREAWDQFYVEAVKRSTEVNRLSFSTAKQELLARGLPSNEDYYIGLKIYYTSLDGRGDDSFTSLARWAGCMDNIKANVPRTAYRGIVTIWKDGVLLHIVPKDLSNQS